MNNKIDISRPHSGIKGQGQLAPGQCFGARQCLCLATISRKGVHRRIVNACLDARIAQTFDKIRLQYGINRNAQIGALASLEDPEFADYVVAETARGREDYYNLARSLGRPYLESCANFVCLDFGSSEAATAIMNALLARGVFIRMPGAAPINRCIRVTVGTAQERAAFAERFAEALAEVDTKASRP